MTRAALITAAAALLVSCGKPNDTSNAQCKSLIAGDLVVTEYYNDPPSTDTGHEWFELHNATTNDINLQGLTLFISRADGTSEKTHVISKPVSIPAGSYLALGDVRDSTLLPPYIGYTYVDALGALSNSDGTIGVRCGTQVIDKVVFTTASKSGHSRELDGKISPDSAVNDSEANFCDATNQFDTGQFGTPGKRNDACGGSVTAGNCLDPDLGVARPTVPPAVGDLVITEFMANPKALADTDGEWFEVLAKRDVDLNGVKLTSGSSGTTVNQTGCVHLAAGQYGLFAKRDNLGVDGGSLPVTAKFTMSLANTSGSAGVALADGTVIDSVQWASVLDGISSQLDPQKLDSSLNDDPANFCAATQTYASGDKGTPGAANTACVAQPNGNSCVDPDTGATRPLMSPVVGDVVISELMPDPNFVSDTTGEWFEVYVPGDVDLNGVKLGNETTSSTTLSSPACIHPVAGSYVLFAKNADSSVNGGLPPVLSTFGFSLSNTG
ncbi:MAG: hypothetical protein ACJ790_13510, partial [Myxococcaceae bacterium]